MLHEILHTHQLFSFLVWNENNTHWLNSSVIQRLFVDDNKKFRAIISTLFLDEIEIVDSLEDGFTIMVRETTEGRVGCAKGGIEFIRLQNCKIEQK